MQRSEERSVELGQEVLTTPKHPFSWYTGLLIGWIPWNGEERPLVALSNGAVLLIERPEQWKIPEHPIGDRWGGWVEMARSKIQEPRKKRGSGGWWARILGL